MAKRHAILLHLATFLAGLVVGAAGVFLVWSYLRGWPAETEMQEVRTLPPDQRPSTWATRIELPGVPNLHRVSADLYRGAQPTPEGFRELEKLGVKTVVNLRFLHSDHDELEGTKLNYVHLHMQAWHPESEDVEMFLRAVADPAKRPVFVHCQYGADRTGTMCAAYRAVMQRWETDEAIREMTMGGFGFHEDFGNLIRFLKKLDAAKLRKSFAPRP